MKRYRMSIGDIGCGPGLFSDETPDGEWVDAEEAEAEVTRLRSALGEALDLAETMYTELTALEPVRLGRTMVDVSGVPDHIERLRTLASKET